MIEQRLMDVLRWPHVSEKATRLADKHRQFTFRVTSEATKPLIKAAVELLFKVEVETVRVCNVKGKKRRFGRIQGRKRGWKKAYVALKPGHEIDFLIQK